MNSQVFQNACDSIIAIAKPDIKMVWFAIAMINLALMAQVTDIDYQNNYRKALVCLKDALDAYREVLDEAQTDD